MRRSRSFATTLLLIAACGASGQAAETTSKSCTAAEHRQFDFWLGAWDVFDPSGTKVGDSRIERINDGCSVLENWSGAGGVTGKSLNLYDAADQQWHQFWVDSSGSRLLLDGKFAAGKMILAATAHRSDKAVMQKITWSRNADGSVRQLWESSSDGGKTWTTSFDGKYVKRG